jgi:hypothetical protein
MTQDEIIEMARQAGFETMLRKGKILGFDRDGDYTEEIEALIELVADVATAKEREACAKVCELTKPTVENSYECNGYECAELIRARGEV